MNRENAMTAVFEEVEVLNQPALYTSLRVHRDTVPDGMYMYEMRHSDDGSAPCELARSIIVNHYGTVLTREPIQLPVCGCLEMDTDSLNFCGGGCRTVTDFMEKYPESSKEVIDFFSVNDQTMRNLFFSQDEEQDKVNGCIGHLRGDFGSGEQFYTTWWPHQGDTLNTSEFKQDIDHTVGWLRAQPDSPLQNFTAMERCCQRYMQSCEIPGTASPSCGFMAKTKQYVYLLRCTPTKGDYNFYIYCYRRQEFEKACTQPGKENPAAVKKKRAEVER